MHDLNEVARRFGVSIGDLRQFAIQDCGVPASTLLAVLDLWLYERLASSINLYGLRGWVGRPVRERLHEQVELGLFNVDGNDFRDKCAASFAEVRANPIIRHEILLMPEWPRLVDLTRLWAKSVTGDVYESVSDFGRGRLTL